MTIATVSATRSGQSTAYYYAPVPEAFTRLEVGDTVYERVDGLPRAPRAQRPERIIRNESHLSFEEQIDGTWLTFQKTTPGVPAAPQEGVDPGPPIGHFAHAGPIDLMLVSVADKRRQTPVIECGPLEIGDCVDGFEKELAGWPESPAPGAWSKSRSTLWTWVQRACDVARKWAPPQSNAVDVLAAKFTHYTRQEIADELARAYRIGHEVEGSELERLRANAAAENARKAEIAAQSKAIRAEESEPVDVTPSQQGRLVIRVDVLASRSKPEIAWAAGEGGYEQADGSRLKFFEAGVFGILGDWPEVVGIGGDPNLTLMGSGFSFKCARKEARTVTEPRSDGTREEVLNAIRHKRPADRRSMQESELLDLTSADGRGRAAICLERIKPCLPHTAKCLRGEGGATWLGNDQWQYADIAAEIAVRGCGLSALAAYDLLIEAIERDAPPACTQLANMRHRVSAAIEQAVAGGSVLVTPFCMLAGIDVATVASSDAWSAVLVPLVSGRNEVRWFEAVGAVTRSGLAQGVAWNTQDSKRMVAVLESLGFEKEIVTVGVEKPYRAFRRVQA